MDASSFNWPLFQLIIDCFLILLILFLLFVLFREHKQRLLLKKWILRQLRLHGVPARTEQATEGHPVSVEEAIERLQREIDLARQILDAFGAKPGVPEGKPAPPEPVEPQPETEVAQSPVAPSPEPVQEQTDTVKEAIRYLLKKGMRPLEISKQLHIPIEEVERAYASGITNQGKRDYP